MPSERYRSITTGTPLPNETLHAATPYAVLQGWERVQERVLAENLMRARTSGRLKRMWSEDLSRLRPLSMRAASTLP